MEKSVALFYFKNILKKFEKVCKNLLTKIKKCAIIKYTRKGEERKVQKMKLLKGVFDWFVFLLTGKGELANEAVLIGAVDFSGQGRDKFGK